MEALRVMARSKPPSASSASRAIGTPKVVKLAPGVVAKAITPVGAIPPKACRQAKAARGVSLVPAPVSNTVEKACADIGIADVETRPRDIEPRRHRLFDDIVGLHMHERAAGEGLDRKFGELEAIARLAEDLRRAAGYQGYQAQIG